MKIFRIFIGNLVSLLFLAPLSAGAEGICPAINCDCNSLPTQKWIQVCQQYEAHIKNECASNFNTPKNYCSIHGEHATPVALTLHLSNDLNATPHQKKEIEQKIDMLMWALKSDLGTAKKMISKQHYAKAAQILKLVDSNIDNVFHQNEQLVHAIMVGEKDDDNKLKESAEVWSEYSSEILGFTVMLEKFSNSLEIDLKHASSNRENKIYRVLATQAYRLAGKTYEQAGYAYGQASQHADAAKTWNLAADVSVHLLRLAKDSGADDNGVQYNELQAAARLQRASYHWIKGDAAKDAASLLKESQAFVDREQQKKLEILVDHEKMVASGGLSFR